MSLLLGLCFALAGLTGGFIAGTIGAGSGIFFMPVYLYLLPQAGIPEHLLVHTAVGTTLATLTLVSSTNTVTHLKYGNLVKPLIIKLVPLACCGALIGSIIADFVDGAWLKLMFQCALLYLAIDMVTRHKRRKHPGVHSVWTLSGLAGLIAIFTSMIGMGLGQILIPVLSRFGLSMTKSIATSASCAILYAITGAVSYMILGANEPNVPTASIGYVYLPAFALAGLFTVIGTRTGAAINRRLPERWVQIAFGILLFIVWLSVVLH